MLYYIHIPKTAGTSLRSFLRNAINGEKMCEVYSDIGYWNAAEYRKGVKDYEIFYGHFSFGFHELLEDNNPYYVTVLRDPIARVVSLYKHHKLIEHAQHYSVIQRESLSLCDFVDSCITHETDNHMVRILSADYGRLARIKYNALNFYSSVTHNNKTFQVKSRNLLQKAYFIFAGTTDRLIDVAAFIADFHRVKWIIFPLRLKMF